MPRTEEFRAECGGGDCTAVLVGGSVDEFAGQLVAHAKDVHGVTDQSVLDRIESNGREQALAQQAASG